MEKVVFLEEKTPDVGDTFIRSSTFKKRFLHAPHIFKRACFSQRLGFEDCVCHSNKIHQRYGLRCRASSFVICKAEAAAQPNTNSEGIGGDLEVSVPTYATCVESK